MKKEEMRIEKDSLGEVKVPKEALYGAQTQRAIDNFPMSDLKLPYSFIRALCTIKASAAKVNAELGLLPKDIAKAIMEAAETVVKGEHLNHFPLDVFQTGSGTSTNMNANEVIAHLAHLHSGLTIHPNDHVNMSQSSNDVIPTAIHVSCSWDATEKLIPALRHLTKTLTQKAKSLQHIVKTGRTHLMDAMPLTFGQELGGWAEQMNANIHRLQNALPHVQALAIGGTAVGTGINAHPEFGKRVTQEISNRTNIPFTSHTNFFTALSSQDAIVEFSGQLRVIAVSLLKISNDLRLMNSGPLAGMAEITLPSLQPGSSIMPGKINPVIPESIMMACAQVIGNDATIGTSGLCGNFQLNTMLPVIAYNILLSIQLMSNSSRMLADKAIAGFIVNEAHIDEKLSLNPILVTALNPLIGYEKAAEIAKKAYKERRPIKEVAKEMTHFTQEELDRLLDPALLTQGGIEKKEP